MSAITVSVGGQSVNIQVGENTAAAAASALAAQTAETNAEAAAQWAAGNQNLFNTRALAEAQQAGGSPLATDAWLTIVNDEGNGGATTLNQITGAGSGGITVRATKEIILNNLAAVEANTSTSISEGQLIFTRDGQSAFEAAASGATDIHRATAGGIGLYDLNFAADARRQTQRLMRVLESDERDAVVSVVGDSTGNATDEWVYLWAVKLAAKYPAFTVNYRLWNDAGSVFDAAVVIQTGTGANTLTIYNGSVTGKEWDYPVGARFSAMIGSLNPDLVLTGYGHNGTDTVNLQISLMDALLCRIADELPFTPVIVVGQNPFQPDTSMRDKTEAFRARAAMRGAGFIDIHAAFEQSPTGTAGLNANDAHPNAAGSSLWARSVMTAFVGTGNAAAGMLRGAASGKIIKSVQSYAEFARWTPVGGGVTLSEDTTNFETQSGSLRIQNAAAANGSIYHDMVSTHSVNAFRGKWVSFAVRLKVTTGDGANTTGRLSLDDGISSATTTRFGGPEGADFYWVVVSKLIDAAATRVRGYIYATTDGATAGAVDMSVDRCILLSGIDFTDDFGKPEINYHRKSVFRSASFDGSLIVQNTGYTTRGITGLAQTFNWQTGSISADYQFMLGGDVCGFKAAADAYDRIQIDNINGRILFGLGTATPPIRFNAASATRMRLTGASFEPSTTNTYDLGLTSLSWKNLYLGTSLFVNSIKVVGTQGAAVADATDAATAITQLNALLARCRAHGLIAT